MMFQGFDLHDQCLFNQLSLRIIYNQANKLKTDLKLFLKHNEEVLIEIKMATKFCKALLRHSKSQNIFSTMPTKF